VALEAESLRGVVDAVAQVAGTLAELAEDGIFHRDLKPDNLFELEGRFLVGDFGLAEFPDKERHTTNDRKLGPWGFLAPEMLNRPREALAGPADVYSLVKTLWVLATDQNWPPLGRQPTSDSRSRLSSFVADGRAAELEPIIERCTENEPADRLTMGELKAELAAWLAPPEGARQPVSSVEALVARVTSLTRPDREAAAAAQQRSDAAQQAFQHLEVLVRPLFEQINAIGMPSNLSPQPDLFGEYFGWGSLGGSGSSLFLGPMPTTTAWLWVGVGWEARPDGSARFFGGIVSGEGASHSPVVLGEATVVPGTARVEHEAQRISDDMHAAFIEAATLVVARTEEQRRRAN
jgi:hypothetical protein